MTSLCIGRVPGASTPVSDRSRVKKRRARLPAVEPLEGRRLARVTTPELPRLAADHELREDLAVLAEPPASSDAESDLDGTGLAQLDRYLNRSWYRAGIPTQRHDDCSQEVYLTLLQGWGLDRFHRLVGDIDRLGICGVVGRETAEGPDFFRAVDRVKKRAQRERTHPALDDAGDLASPRREELTVQRLARHAKMSTRTFNRRFRDETGQSPGAWIRSRRIDRARELLESRDLPVDEVARLSGLGTGGNLRHHLRRGMGMSPSSYRKVYQGA